MSRFGHTRLSVALITVLVCAAPTFAQVAIKADTIYTMAGEPIRDGVVVIVDGEIRSVGPAASTQIPQGMRVMNAKVATPGLIDARATVGLTGITNQEQDQDIKVDNPGPQVFGRSGTDEHDRQKPQDAQEHHDDTRQGISDPLDAQWRGPSAKGVPDFSMFDDADDVYE